jgi:hypothetical protein
MLQLTIGTRQLTPRMLQLAPDTLQLTHGARKLAPDTLQLAHGARKLAPDTLQLTHGARKLAFGALDFAAQALADAFALDEFGAYALELRDPLGTGALNLGAGSARMAHELLGEAHHLAPRGTLLAFANAQLALEVGHAPIGNGGRLLDLYDRARAGGVLTHDRPECKGVVHAKETVITR